MDIFEREQDTYMYRVYEEAAVLLPAQLVLLLLCFVNKTSKRILAPRIYSLIAPMRATPPFAIGLTQRGATPAHSGNVTRHPRRTSETAYFIHAVTVVEFSRNSTFPCPHPATSLTCRASLESPVNKLNTGATVTCPSGGSGGDRICP